MKNIKFSFHISRFCKFEKKFEMQKTIIQLRNAVLVFTFIQLLFSCANPGLKKHTISGKALGTYYTIHYYAVEDFKFSKEEIQLKIDSLLNDFNKTASIYDSTSIISKFNSNKEFETNEMFNKIFIRSLEISEQTLGAFDISVGNLVNAWGFGSTEFSAPEDKLIDSLLQYIGRDKLKFINGKPVKAITETKIDMNGIAKGYSVDLVSSLFENLGIKSYIVEIGGEIRVGMTKPEQKPWVVAVEKPSKDALSEQEIQRKVYIANSALATSGNYRRYYEIDGKRFSHTIDPKTGKPVSHNLLSATVIAKDCMTADALATAFMVMGHEAALEFCKNHKDVEAYFIVAKGNDDWEIYYTPGFEKFL